MIRLPDGRQTNETVTMTTCFLYEKWMNESKNTAAYTNTHYVKMIECKLPHSLLNSQIASKELPVHHTFK